jgi:glutaredoxin 3
MVKVYSISNCPWCDKVKKYLKLKNIAYEEFNVEDDDDARNELYKISGDQIVPLTTIDGKAYVISFDKAKLDALLNL